MRIEQLTFTRFIAAFAIVVFHFGRVYPFNLGIIGTLFNNANVAVSYFFTLSGFVMIVAYFRRSEQVSVKDYYINRLAKIYPVYITALLLAMMSAENIIPGKFISEVLLINAAIPWHLSAYNLPGWSLSVEAFFYLAFPLLCNWVYLKFSLKTVVYSVGAFWFGSQVFYYMISFWPLSTVGLYANAVYYHPLVHLNEFIAGNLTGLIFLSIQRTHRFKSDMPLMVLLTVLAIACLMLLPFTKTYDISKLPVNLHNGLLVLVFAPLILLLSLNHGYISRALSWRPLVVLGEISYCIYLLQFPVYRGFGHLTSPTDATLHFLLYTLLLLFVSYITYIMIERPARNYIRQALTAK